MWQVSWVGSLWHAGRCVLVAWLLAGAAGAASALAAPERPPLSLAVWLEPGHAASIDQVAALPATAWRAAQIGQVHDLGGDHTLWLRLRLQRGADEPVAWRLTLPVALIDEVTLFERQGSGWRTQRAGDAVAVADWSRPGRHPAFDLRLEGTAPRTVYLQVRHSDPIGFPLTWQPAAEAERADLQEHLALGLALGCLMVLAAWCLVQVALHRDAIHVWYALYGLTLLLAVGTVTGVAGYLLWDESPRWADAAQGVVPMLTAGVHLLFMVHLCALWGRHPWVSRAAFLMGWAVVALACAYPWLGAVTQRYVVAAAMLTSELVGMALAVLAWRRGDRVGPLVLLAYAPLALAVGAAVLRLFGIIPAGWFSLDSAALAAALAVPLLLLALNERARFRLGVLDRLQHSASQDALTGVLTASAFTARLQTAVTGAFMRGEGSAVLLVDLGNLRRIREFHGDAATERCLLRLVMLLNRVVRPSDPVGRIDTGRFAVLVEGSRSRGEVKAAMVRLVASGLSPGRGGEAAIPMQLRVACAMLPEKVNAPAALLRELGALVERIAPQSRRPVRFLEPGEDPASVPEGQEEEAAA